MVLVGNTFHDVVIKSDKDVLVLLCSRRSDACKPMDKVYKVSFNTKVSKVKCALSTRSVHPRPRSLVVCPRQGPW